MSEIAIDLFFLPYSFLSAVLFCWKEKWQSQLTSLPFLLSGVKTM